MHEASILASRQMAAECQWKNKKSWSPQTLIFNMFTNGDSTAAYEKKPVAVADVKEPFIELYLRRPFF